MLLRLDDRDDVPLYLQIAASVRGAIANGELAPGDRLPAARTLAASLGVNMHTVLRGYAELEQEGLVSLRRGRGVMVTAESPGRARLLELVREVGREARRLGIAPDEVEALLREHA
jgi:DNA-binding transcriptional regulator YhcF (GntR family)